MTSEEPGIGDLVMVAIPGYYNPAVFVVSDLAVVVLDGSEATGKFLIMYAHWLGGEA